MPLIVLVSNLLAVSAGGQDAFEDFNLSFEFAGLARGSGDQEAESQKHRGAQSKIDRRDLVGISRFPNKVVKESPQRKADRENSAQGKTSMPGSQADRDNEENRELNVGARVKIDEEHNSGEQAPNPDMIELVDDRSEVDWARTNGFSPLHTVHLNLHGCLRCFHKFLPQAASRPWRYTFRKIFRL